MRALADASSDIFFRHLFTLMRVYAGVQIESLMFRCIVELDTSSVADTWVNCYQSKSTYIVSTRIAFALVNVFVKNNNEDNMES